MVLCPLLVRYNHGFAQKCSLIGTISKVSNVDHGPLFSYHCRNWQELAGPCSQSNCSLNEKCQLTRYSNNGDPFHCVVSGKYVFDYLFIVDEQVLKRDKRFVACSTVIGHSRKFICFMQLKNITFMHRAFFRFAFNLYKSNTG